MPRYYFHLTDGKNVLSNHQGIDLAGNAAAHADAVALADDLRRGTKMPGWKWDGHANGGPGPFLPSKT